MTAAAFNFAPMAPDTEVRYQRLMEHADNCMNDVQTHEHNLALHMALCGNAFPGLQSMGRLLVEQSAAMELEARELAYLVLTSSTKPSANDSGQEGAPKKSVKPRPYYRKERW